MIDWNRHVSGAVAVGGIESALTTLQPIRDLAKNWDIDIAAWYEQTKYCIAYYNYLRSLLTKNYLLLFSTLFFDT